MVLRGCVHRPKAPGRPSRSVTIPDWAYREPDPLIYSQEWLMSQGLAVTWQNPDVHLVLASASTVPVPSHALKPDTVYRIVANVWNGSPYAPVAQLPVHFSYLHFGIGGGSTAIGSTEVDLPVKGAAGTPAVATIDWRTPAAPAHYCIQVRLDWPFDANPKNNMGQHNVDVKQLNSPKAMFVVPVRNDRRGTLRLRLEVDAYALGAPPPCPPAGREAELPERRRAQVLASHSAGHHPLPNGWSVTLSEPADGLLLAAGETVDVTVTALAPEGFKGRQAINLKAVAGTDLIGGVTLIAEGDADG